MKKIIFLILLPIITLSQNSNLILDYPSYLNNKNLNNSHNNYINNLTEDNFNSIISKNLENNHLNDSYYIENVTSYLSYMVNLGCKLDIVLAFDVSGSNASNNYATCLASNQFLTSFLTELDPEMDGSITGVLGNNSVQVGICTWSTLDANLCDNGGQGANIQVSKMTTSASYLDSFATASSYNEIICVPIFGSDFYYASTFMGMQNLNDYSNSSLGDRSGQANYQRILIISTDANSSNACLQSTSGGSCAIDMQNDVWDFGVQTIAVAVRSTTNPPLNWQSITSCLVEDPLDQYEGNGQTLAIVGQTIANDICIPIADQMNYCFNDSTFFSINQNVDSIIWDFGDPISGINNYSNDLNPYHIFSDTGTFYISIDYYNSGILNSLFDTIQIYSNPNHSYFESNISCFGFEDGYIDININQDFPPYFYSWNNGQSSEDLDSLIPGVYSILITDSNGCTSQESIILTEPSPLVSSIQSLTNFNGFDISCFGDSMGSIDLLVSGSVSPYSYQWSGMSLDTTEDLSNLSSGLYIAAITDQNGCTSQASIILTEPNPLASSIQSLTNFNGFDISCFGDSMGSIDLLASGSVPPYSYQWSGMSIDTSEDLSNLSSGLYTVSITDMNACELFDSIIVSEPFPLVSSIQSLTNFNGFDISCFGDSMGSIDLLVSGSVSPYSYQWSGMSLDTTEDLSNLSSGLYSVAIIDQNGCELFDSIIVSEPTQLINNSNAVNPTCNGYSNGSITLLTSGSIYPYTYLWNTGDSIQNLQNIATGQYSVIISNANNCIIYDTLNIIEPSPIVGTDSSNNVSCFGATNASVTFTFSGGTPGYIISAFGQTYPLLNPNSITIPSYIPISAGVYAYSISDIQGCLFLDTVTISQPSPISNSNSISYITCSGFNNGSITINPQGGTSPYTYLWGTGDTTQSLLNLFSGQYYLSILDANNCIGKDTILMLEPTNLNDSSSISTPSCNGFNDGSASVIVSGGTPPYFYLWSTGDTSQTIQNIYSGQYLVSIFDSNSCILYDTLNIYQPSSIFISDSITNISCFGLSDGNISLSVTGGTGSYVLLWDNGDSTSYLDNLYSQWYNISIMDSNSCLLLDSFMVMEPSLFEDSIYHIEPSCYSYSNGIITAFPFGSVAPYSFLWNTGDTTQMLQNVTIGQYSVVITDHNNCIINDTVNLDHPLQLSCSNVIDSVSCYEASDGNIDLTVSGGVYPYTYLWSNGDTTQDIINLSSNTYIVNILDSNNCLLISNFLLEEPEDLFAFFNFNYVSCFGLSDGYIDGNTIGGTAPYSYLWNTGDSTEDLLNIPSNTYTLSLTDTNNCFFSDTIFIFEPDLLVADLSYISGTIISIAYGGTVPYTYDVYGPNDNLWATASNNYGVEFVINPVLSGIYTLVVTDANGCIDSSKVNILPSSIFNISATNNLLIYPNPTTNSVFIKSETGGEFILYSILGEIVMKQKISMLENINISHLDKGTYFLYIETEDGVFNKKLILQ